MGILTGKQIKGLVKDKELIIDNFDESLVQPASCDLRLFHKVLASPIGERVVGNVVDLRTCVGGFSILSGQMIAVLSLEKLTLPLNMSGRFGIRSSFSRKGIIAFGGLQLDPGFRGRLLMNLLNVGPEPVSIKYKEPIFSVELSRLEEAVEYGYNGEYQDQDDFPVDQYNYILSARTTSLAEIPILRSELGRLTGLLEECEELLPDPDKGLILKAEIEKRLLSSAELPKVSLLSAKDILSRSEC